MSKRFINLKDVEEQVSNGKIYVDKNAILSSTLKDYVREHNIEVVFGEETCNEKPSATDCACLKAEIAPSSKEEECIAITRMVVKILKNDFGIENEEIILKVVKIISEVLK